MRVALYVRVSTQHQAHTQTIDQQLDRLRAHVAEHGWTLPNEAIFRDDGFSGATLHRPGLERLREQVAAGALDCVLLTAPDRLARNYAHQVLLLDEFARAGVRVEFLDRPMSQDPHDQLVMQIRGAVAEYERSLIADRMRRGRQQKLRAGLLLPWTRPPFGYAVDPERPRDPAGVRLDAPAAALVAEIFAYYLEDGHSLVGLAKHLMARQIPTANGHWRWNAASLRDILTNPVYTGTLYTGRTRSRATQRRHSPLVPVGPPSTHQTPTDPSEWVAIGQVPAIVTVAQFAAVRAKMAQNQQFARRHNTAHRYLLRALVSCGRCAGACFGRTAPGEYPYYVCRGKQHPVQSHQDQRCSAPYIRVQDLDALVWQDLCALLTTPEALTTALQRAQSGEWLPQELAARRENLRAARKSVEQQVERLTAAYLAGIMPLEEYQRRRADLESRQASLETQMQQLAAQVDRQQELAGIVTAIEAFRTRVCTGLEQASFEQRRQLVELLIDRVVVTDEEVEIRYVIPTSAPSEHLRFCHLRLDYFDGPMRPPDRFQFRDAHIGRRHTGQRIPDPLLAFAARSFHPHTRPAQHLGDPRPAQVARGIGIQGRTALQRARLPAAMPLLLGHVPRIFERRRLGAPRRVGEQLGNRPLQGRLVVLDDEEIVPALVEDLGGQGLVGMQRIEREQHPVQIQSREQGRGESLLTALGSHLILIVDARRAGVNHADGMAPRSVREDAPVGFAIEAEGALDPAGDRRRGPRGQ